MQSTYQDDLEQHFLVHLHKFLVPFFNVGRLFTGIGVVVICCRRVTLVVNAPLDHFVEDRLVDLRWKISL